MSERVSVIIPAFKAEKTIQRAISSVLAQSHPAHEIIVVDDGSPDQQAEVVAQYGPAVRLIRQPNGKTARARNTGIEAATGNYIAFLDADDYWEPDKLLRQLIILQRHPTVGMVAGAFFEEQPDGTRNRVITPSRRYRDHLVEPRGVAAFRVAAQVWTGTVIVRREVLGNERFITGLEPAEDRDLWVRLVLRAPVFLAAEPLASAVLLPGSISRGNVAQDCCSMLKVVERHRKTLGLCGTCQWKSHTFYRWAACDDYPRSALPRLLASFCLWPLPYLAFDDMRFLGRLKRLVTLANVMATRSPRGDEVIGT